MLLGAAVITAAALGPLVWTLAARVPNETNVTLADDARAGQSVPVAIVDADGPRQRTAPLWLGEPELLREADYVALLVSTSGTRPTVTTLDLEAAGCRFTLDRPVTPATGALIRLTRRGACAAPAPGRVTVGLSTPGALGLLTWYQPRTAAVSGPRLTLTAPEADAPTNAMVRGRYGRALPGVAPTRLGMIGWAWGASARLAAAVLTLAAGLLVTGVWLILQGSWPRIICGGGLCALVVAAGWAVVVPPLQGADEPDHLLSFAEVNGMAAVPAELETLARGVHFERLRFRAHERIGPGDRDTPHPVAWTGDIHSERMDRRSPLARNVWAALGDLGVAGLSVRSTLLGLRLAGALLFALAAALLLVLIARLTTDTQAWRAAGLLLIPTVPYFATMMSDWSLVASATVVLTGALMVMPLAHSRSGWVGLTLGLTIAVLASASVVSLTLLPLLAAVLVWRLAGASHKAEGPRSAVWFWSGFAVALLIAWVLTHDIYSAGYERLDAREGTGAAFLAAVNMAVRWLADYGWTLMPLAALVFVVEWRLSFAVRRPAVARLVRPVVHTAALALAAGLLATLVYSLVADLPQLATLEANRPPTVWAYVQRAVVAVATFPRLAGFDHLTFTSLWSGFGWIDAILPAWLLATLALLATVAIAAAIVIDWRERATARQAFRLAIVIGGLGAVTAAAIASYLMGRNLHGRYLFMTLVPLMVVPASVAWAHIARLPWWGRVILGAALAALHGGALAWVAMRYY